MLDRFQICPHIQYTDLIDINIYIPSFAQKMNKLNRIANIFKLCYMCNMFFLKNNEMLQRNGSFQCYLKHSSATKCMHHTVIHTKMTYKLLKTSNLIKRSSPKAMNREQNQVNESSCKQHSWNAFKPCTCLSFPDYHWLFFPLPIYQPYCSLFQYTATITLVTDHIPGPNSLHTVVTRAILCK